MEIYAQIRTLAARGELSHAYLITGPDPAQREKLALFLAQALLCEGPEPPCGTCLPCRKAEKGIHPDLLRLERLPKPDSAKEKRQYFVVDQVRAMGMDAAVVPNEGRRKVFLLPEADTMNPQAQNALLKLLEEPPAYAAFLLLGANPGAFLETVRSRCVLLRAPGSASSGGDPAAAELAEAWADRNALALAACAYRAEKLDKERFDRFLEAVYAAAGLRAKAGGPGAGRALELAALMEKLRSMRKQNVSPGHCMGLVLSAMEE